MTNSKPNLALKPIDIDNSFQAKIYTQDYQAKLTIEGVKVIKLNTFVGEDGDFTEIIHFDEQSEFPEIPGFKVAQINHSRLLPNAVKAWHLHFRQDEIWYSLPQDNLLLGLWDLREKSATKGKTMRIALGSGKAKLIFIPKGVAHGAANFSTQPAQIIYLVTERFNLQDPDEKRLAWNSLGDDFWQPQRD